MSALALFWPHAGLARVGDPLAVAREMTVAPTSVQVAEAVAAELRRTGSGQASVSGGAGAPVWESFFGYTDAVPPGLVEPGRGTEATSFALVGVTDPGEYAKTDHAGVSGHVDRAVEAIAGRASRAHRSRHTRRTRSVQPGQLCLASVVQRHPERR